MKTCDMLNLNAILEYKNAILGLDSSIVCKTYENDLIFIIAIDDDKYEQFKKDINRIFFKLYSKFELEKKIVCMPNKFVSKWDTPIVLIDSKFELEKEIVYKGNKFTLGYDVTFDRFDSQVNLDKDTNQASLEFHSLFNKENTDIRSNIYNVQDRNEYKINSQGVKNECAA
ncbi:MAG: hypothetical protein K2N12_03420 [Helicobacter sp.]|nr:hypothetical protein [Helicobacter sp.]